MNHTVSQDIVVVTPVYEDREASSRLFRELGKVFGERLAVIAVDDGSVSQPLGIDVLESAGVSGAVVKLRRNVGHQRAIAVGLGYVAEWLREDQRVIVMDSDGEDLPASVPRLLEELRRDDLEVVVAGRRSRVETLRFKIFYQIYKRFFSLMTGREISFGNFMALKPRAVRRLVAMQESPIHVAAAVIASKLRRSAIQIDRGPRYAGQSKMNFVGLVLHGFKALMVFAEDVLVRVGIACAFLATLAIGGGVAALILKLLGSATPGWFTAAFGILVLMFLQTAALALMSLLLTGVMRGGTVAASFAHRDFIDAVLSTDPASRKS